jgi:hypothetical protein
VLLALCATGCRPTYEELGCCALLGALPVSLIAIGAVFLLEL